jgi:hypothetical protein
MVATFPNLAVFARSSGLPDVEAGDGAADDHALDLRGALEDGEVVRGGHRRLGLMFVIFRPTWRSSDGR